MYLQAVKCKGFCKGPCNSSHGLMQWLLCLSMFALQTAWARFGEFLKERAELANRDWLSVRDEAWRVEDFLNKWAKTTEGNVGSDPVALILAKEIDSYRQVAHWLIDVGWGDGDRWKMDVAAMLPASFDWLAICRRAKPFLKSTA